MTGPIHLSLLMGPLVAAPAPAVVVESLTAVQVTGSNERSGFQLTFAAGARSPVLKMLATGFFDPMVTRVIIVATVNGTPTVLMDGIVTRHDLAPSNEPGHATLTITGEDLSILMDVIEMNSVRFPSQPEVSQVYTILSKYAALGVVPLVVPPVISEVSTDNTPTQSGTDREYIRQLAQQCGYVFYIEPGPTPGASIAYFGPDIRIPIPQPALTVNMDAHTNVESLSFSFDGTAKKQVIATVFDPTTKRQTIPIPVPDISVLRPPLGARPAPPARVEFMTEAAKLTLAEAAKRAMAAAFRSTDAITGSGSLDVSRYGRVLRPRGLVGVRGAGEAYDGMYYVNSVTHDLRPGRYTQQFNLTRDGLVSTTAAVPV